MRFLIGILLGLAAGYVIASALSQRMEERHRPQFYQEAGERPVQRVS